MGTPHRGQSHQAEDLAQNRVVNCFKGRRLDKEIPTDSISRRFHFPNQLQTLKMLWKVQFVALLSGVCKNFLHSFFLHNSCYKSSLHPLYLTRGVSLEQFVHTELECRRWRLWTSREGKKMLNHLKDDDVSLKCSGKSEGKGVCTSSEFTVARQR